MTNHTISGCVMSGATSTVTVLALLPAREDQASLSEIFKHSRWNLHSVETIGQARSLLDDLAAGVVLSDTRLADGDWQDVLYELARRPVEPPLIVTSRMADDRLWSAVLHLGGYDVLALPFHAHEVFRSVSQAWRHWRSKVQAAGVAVGKERAVGAGGGLRLAF